MSTDVCRNHILINNYHASDPMRGNLGRANTDLAEHISLLVFKFRQTKVRNWRHHGV